MLNERICPDLLMIQAVVDGEAEKAEISVHLQGCPSCRQAYKEIKALSILVDGLRSEAVLPQGFGSRLNFNNGGRALPVAAVVAVIFVLVAVSTWLIEPGYLNWWLSVGITRQFGFYIDLFFNIIYMGQSLGPIWIISALFALVALELFMLNKLNLVEGWKKC